MWDWESVLIVVAVVIIAIIAAAFVAFALDQYYVCRRGGYIGGDCMQWECFCYEIGEDGIKRFVPLPQVREENAR